MDDGLSRWMRILQIGLKKTLFSKKYKHFIVTGAFAIFGNLQKT